MTPSSFDTTVDGETHRVPTDTLVVASEVAPGSGLATNLEARGVEVHVEGDAADVGYIEGAIHSAWAVATQI